MVKISGCDHCTCKREPCHHRIALGLTISTGPLKGCGYEYCWACLAPHDEIDNEGNHAHYTQCPHYRAFDPSEVDSDDDTESDDSESDDADDEAVTSDTEVDSNDDTESDDSESDDDDDEAVTSDTTVVRNPFPVRPPPSRIAGYGAMRARPRANPPQSRNRLLARRQHN